MTERKAQRSKSDKRTGVRVPETRSTTPAQNKCSSRPLPKPTVRKPKPPGK